ncbi:MAG: hypothetical protein J3K34DRAFT_437534 [Monoraphidium minutum]|nr:MAG: hypothetical protein J3K34DRAFT_437534 [Monoraphidium minutum]
MTITGPSVGSPGWRPLGKCTDAASVPEPKAMVSPLPILAATSWPLTLAAAMMPAQSAGTSARVVPGSPFCLTAYVMSVAISSSTESLSDQRRPNADIQVPAQGQESGPASRVMRVLRRWATSDSIAITRPLQVAPVPCSGSQNAYSAPLKPRMCGSATVSAVPAV